MENKGLGLPLFRVEEFDKTHDQPYKIPEEKIVAPVVEVLEAITPSENKPEHIEDSPALKQSLDDLFPEQLYDEKEIQKAKQILGQIAKEFTDEELKGAVAELQYLAEVWVTAFERKIFKGMTLKELLHERGGL